MAHFPGIGGSEIGTSRRRALEQNKSRHAVKRDGFARYSGPVGVRNCY